MDQNNSILKQNKAIQIIMLSLSVVAFIAFQYSSLFSSIKLLSYSSTDRHYIFLICNGLMLLVIKSSGLFAASSPPGTEFYRDSHVIRNAQHQSAGFRESISVKANVVSHQPTYHNEITCALSTDELVETKAESCLKAVAKVEEAKGETVVMDSVITTADYHVEQEEADDLIDEQQQEKEEEQEEVRQKDEEEQEHEIMLWSTEELNKKCDDFIRKMKYGIKHEARLVMV